MQMRAREIINESMWLYPAKLEIRKEDNEEIKYLSPVFPREWTESNLGWRDLPNGGEEPIDNPKYRPDMDMNLSNDNMGDMMDSLGFNNDGDSSYNIPIDQFIQACQRWLKQHLDKPTGGRDSFEHERETTGGNINYEFILKKLIKDKTAELLADPELRKEAEALVRVASKAKDGNFFKGKYVDVESTMQELASRRATGQAEFEVQQLQAKNTQFKGPRMIQGGREEGYLNKKIMKALKIAQEGKSRGAEYISAA